MADLRRRMAAAVEAYDDKALLALLTQGRTATRLAGNAGAGPVMPEQRIDEDDDLTHKVYRTMRDSRVRATQEALDGVCLPKEDSLWETRSAPTGWRCRCKCYGVNAKGIARLKARGVKLKEERPQEEMVTYTVSATGENETLPASVEPGWGLPTRHQGRGEAAGQAAQSPHGNPVR
jgi:hypothetical protein